MSLFDKSSVPLGKTGSFDQLILDYLAGEPKLKGFYNWRPDSEGFRASIAARSGNQVDRISLVEVLKDQYAWLSGHPDFNSTSDTLKQLLDENTFTVCTGHQLNLFGGPLFTVYKIISTIKTAKSIEAKTGKRIIPVFWMATEDHDMEEIDHVYLYSKKYEWKSGWKGAAGRASCQGINELIREISEKFTTETYVQEWTEILSESYKPEYNLSLASRRFFHRLFGKYGLIILDADDKRLKKNLIGDMLTDLIDHTAEEQVKNTADKLAGDYKVQVTPRNINLFYLGEGSRDRIEKRGNTFCLVDKDLTWTPDEIKSELEAFPERFSPNVVMRPLYQEKVLPDIAVIGGPGEIAYWLEYKSYFTASEVFFPLLLLRNSALIIDYQSLIKMKKFRLSTEQLFHSPDEWIRDYLKNDPAETLDLSEFMHSLDLQFKSIADQAVSIDPTLKSSIEAEGQKVHKILTHLEERILRALKKKNETEINQLRKLKEKLFPFGKLQERSEGVISYLFKHGDRFIEELIENFQLPSSSMIILKEQSADKLTSVPGGISET